MGRGVALAAGARGRSDRARPLDGHVEGLGGLLAGVRRVVEAEEGRGHPLRGDPRLRCARGGEARGDEASAPGGGCARKRLWSDLAETCVFWRDLAEKERERLRRHHRKGQRASGAAPAGLRSCAAGRWAPGGQDAGRLPKRAPWTPAGLPWGSRQQRPSLTSRGPSCSGPAPRAEAAAASACA